jgi:hypothetical protein
MSPRAFALGEASAAALTIAVTPLTNSVMRQASFHWRDMAELLGVDPGSKEPDRVSG